MKSEEDPESIDIQKLQKGVQTEFEKAYTKYVRKVYFYAFKTLGCHEDAEEITQEVFCAIWQQRTSIRSEGFIWIVVKHKCIDRLRKPQTPVLTDEELDTLSYSTSVDEKLSVEEQRQKWQKKLSVGEQQVFSLLLKGLSRDEIAKLLDLPLGTVDSRLHRLKEKIKGGTDE